MSLFTFNSMLYYADTASDIISSDRPAQPAAGWNVPITKTRQGTFGCCTKVSRMYKLFLYSLSLTSILTATVIPVRTATSVPIFTIAYASYSAAVAILRTAPILKVKVIILWGTTPQEFLVMSYAGTPVAKKKWRS